MRRPLACVLVLSCALPLSAFAGPKKKKAPAQPAPAPAEKLISEALDHAEGKVGGFVLETAPPGAWTKVVTVKVSLNGAGQL